MAIDNADVVAEYGAYYIPGRANVNQIWEGIKEEAETDELFIYIPTKATRLEYGASTITSVLQGYQDEFTPKGDTKFTPRPIDLFQVKMDLKENPSKFEGAWNGFLAGDSISRKDWPFVRYWIEKLILPQSVEDWEVKAVFGGVKGAITPGTPQAIEYGVDGIKKQINDAITAGDMSPIVVGAVPTDEVDFVDYVEKFVDGIPDKYLNKLGPLAMSKTLEKRFRRGMRKKYNMSYEQANVTTVMDHDNLKVKGLTSHSGSTKIWTTLNGNAIRSVKKPNNQKMFNIQEVDRDVKLLTDWWKICTFVRFDWVLTNDVELS